MKKYLPKNLSQKGFTLIELLVVISIIVALSVAIFAALNPAGRLKDTRNAKRTSDVDTILTAIHQYIVDNQGGYPGTLAANGTEWQLGTGASGTCGLAQNGCTPGGTCQNLTTALAPYLKSIPIDPGGPGTSWGPTKTGYTVKVDTNGIVTVAACGLEVTTSVASISASR